MLSNGVHHRRFDVRNKSVRRKHLHENSVQSDTTGLSGGVPDTHTSTCWAAVSPSPEAVPEDAWENI